MEEKELKTKPWQRVAIGGIAVLMLGAVVAGYAAIVVGGNSSSSAGNQVDAEKVAEYQKEYEEKEAAFTEITKADFEKFKPFLSEVTAYNETAANENGLQMEDLLVGEGKELVDGDEDYLAYYVGWCADESVFDSSFDSAKNPTKFAGVLDPSGGLIEGWDLGVVGMKLGGIREVTIPGELAYKDTKEICGGTNKPLKFMIMAVANEEPLVSASEDLQLAALKVQTAQYGVDYEQIIQNVNK